MISGKEMAEQLGVAPATLSQAAAKGHLCRGHDVSAWAVRGPGGRVMGYDVPPSVAARLTPVPEPLSGDGLPTGTRPLWKPSPEADSNAVAAAAARPPPPELIAMRDNPSRPSVHSILPPGEDYFQPAVAASTAVVVKEALRQDNASGRLVITTASVAVAALAGRHVGGKTGALLGGSLALLASWWFYRPEQRLASRPTLERPPAPPAALSLPRPAVFRAMTRVIPDNTGVILESARSGGIAPRLVTWDPLAKTKRSLDFFIE